MKQNYKNAVGWMAGGQRSWRFHWFENKGTKAQPAACLCGQFTFSPGPVMDTLSVFREELCQECLKQVQKLHRTAAKTSTAVSMHDHTL